MTEATTKTNPIEEARRIGDPLHQIEIKVIMLAMACNTEEELAAAWAAISSTASQSIRLRIHEIGGGVDKVMRQVDSYHVTERTEVIFKRQSRQARLARLFELYEQGMYRIAYAILHDDGQAEDAVMAAFERIVRREGLPPRPESDDAAGFAAQSSRAAP